MLWDIEIIGNRVFSSSFRPGESISLEEYKASQARREERFEKICEKMDNAYDDGDSETYEREKRILTSMGALRELPATRVGNLHFR